MNKDADRRQVDSGVKKGQTELPDRSGRLTGHTKHALKGDAVKDSPQKERQSVRAKPQNP